MVQKIEHSVSPATILTVVAIFVGGWLAIKLADLILLVVVALMIASALDPLVTRFAKRMPLSVASSLVVLGILLPIIAVVAAGIPGLIDQGPATLRSLTEAVKGSSWLPESVRSGFDLTQYADSAGGYLLQSISTITSAVTAAVSLIFLTIYLLIDRDNLKRLLVTFVPRQHRARTLEMARTFASISGQYIRGNLIISLVCGVTVFVGLLILGVPGAALLALFAALFDLLPLVGGIVAAIPAVILAFSVSTTDGLLVIALFTLYQQFENHILAPNIYNKALNLSPVVTFLAVIAGSALYGIAGAFISLPLAASIPAAIKYIQEYES